jgi:hypothetical protein
MAIRKPLTASTELEAVNFLLLSIGEQPINDLYVTGVSEVSIARSLIHQVSRQVQANGMSFNQEASYRLPLSTENEIIVPSNTLKVDASDTSRDIVIRGDRLYDKEKHTFTFEESIDVDIVFFLTFGDLPQTVRDFIITKSARLFQSKIVGSQALYAFSEQDEQQTYITMIRAENDSQDLNMLNNASIKKALRR